MNVSQITFTAIGQVTVTEGDGPGAPGEGQAVVAVSHVGICGSDLAVLAGHHPWTKPPVVTGHEVSGWVRETGAGRGPGISR